MELAFAKNVSQTTVGHFAGRVLGSLALCAMDMVFATRQLRAMGDAIASPMGGTPELIVPLAMPRISVVTVSHLAQA